MGACADVLPPGRSSAPLAETGSAVAAGTPGGGVRARRGATPRVAGAVRHAGVTAESVRMAVAGLKAGVGVLRGGMGARGVEAQAGATVQVNVG